MKERSELEGGVGYRWGGGQDGELSISVHCENGSGSHGLCYPNSISQPGSQLILLDGHHYMTHSRRVQVKLVGLGQSQSPTERWPKPNFPGIKWRWRHLTRSCRDSKAKGTGWSACEEGMEPWPERFQGIRPGYQENRSQGYSWE